MALAAGASPFELLLLLVLSHFLCDFGLQSDRMACEKCAGHDTTLPWGWWLGAHVAIHGLGVALITGVPLLALPEALLHAVIDRLKCRGRFGMPTDQALHLGCKVLWVALLQRG